MSKPIIVYVSGAPGSGKTTLAKLLSEELYIPLVSSDLIHGGVAFTKPRHERRETLLNVFVPTMFDMAGKGISFVADHVLQKGISESDIIEKLRPSADIINVHTMSLDPLQRYVERIEQSSLPSIVNRRKHLLSLVEAHKANLDKTLEPLVLGVPQIVVSTDHGYAPVLSEIIDFIHENRHG